MIRIMTVEDGERVLEIYKMGLDTRNATFETRVPLWPDWDQKHLQHSRFVYIDADQIMGWVALTPFSTRQVYQGVAEVSIYVDERFRGTGIGSALMKKVIASSEDHGIWTLFSSVFPENTATLKLHQKFGFRVIGTREKIARLEGRWRDTVMLERRSTKPEFNQ
jgi:L-amino acid N-acyltransferase YncA